MSVVRSSLAVALIAALGPLAIATPAQGAGRAVSVIRVVDGDTVRVRGGGPIRVVHLAGIRVHGNRTCKGRFARARLARILRPGRRIIIRGHARRCDDVPPAPRCTCRAVGVFAR